MSNPETPTKKGKTVSHFYLMGIAFVLLAIVSFWKAANTSSPAELTRTINGLPALEWQASNPTDFALYSEQETDGAYRYLCTTDERKCLPAKEIADYINANGSKR